MTQKEKIQSSIIFAMHVKNIAQSIRSEGNDYDMQWHKMYCTQLEDLSNELLKKLK